MKSNFMNRIKRVIAVRKNSNTYLKVLSLLFLIGISQTLFAQNEGSDNDIISSFSGAVTIQSKGISTIPNLTLGKPAIAFDMKVGRKLTFEPQFRFSLEGKPWAIVFWWRYNESITEKFSLNFSANHSLSFKSIPDPSSATSQEIIRAGRYLVGTLTPNYQATKNIGVSMYLFYARGLDQYVAKNLYLVSFRPSFSNIPVTKNISARFNPQVYYLNMNKKDGVFLNSTVSISKKDCPLSVSALINKTLKSNITSEYDLLWNVSMTYSFGKNYKEVR